MSWHDIREWVANALYGLIRWTLSTASIDPKTRFVGVGGHEGDPSDPETQWQARVMQHYGFASLPKKGAELVTASIGGEGNNSVSLAEFVPGKGPQDLKDGDVSAFGWNDGQVLRFNEAGDTALTTAGASIRIDNAGQVNIDAASGKDLIFNGGTAKVARVGDRAKFTLRVVQTPVVGAPVPTFNLTVSVVAGVTATILFQITVLGAATFPAPGAPYDVEIDPEIFEGAPHVLA